MKCLAEKVVDRLARADVAVEWLRATTVEMYEIIDGYRTEDD